MARATWCSHEAAGSNCEVGPVRARTAGGEYSSAPSPKGRGSLLGVCPTEDPPRYRIGVKRRFERPVAASDRAM